MKKALYITMLISATVGTRLGISQASATQDGLERTVHFDLPNPAASPLGFFSNCIIVMPNPGPHPNSDSPTHTQGNALGVQPLQMSLNDNALVELPSVVSLPNSDLSINNKSLLFIPPFNGDQK
jgi:hypothetical protein